MTTAAPEGNPAWRGWSILRRWLVANTLVPAWLPAPWRRLWVGYLVAVTLELVAGGADVLINGAFPTFAYPGLVPILAIGALTWGAGPSLAATVLGAVLLNYLVLPPAGQWDLDGPDDAVEVGLFLAVGALISIGASRARRARQDADAARTVAETATRRLQAVQSVSDIALAHLGLDDLLQALLDRVTEILAVDNTAILLPDETGQNLVIHTIRGPEEAVADQVRVPIGQGIAGTIAASRAPLIVDDLSTATPVNPFLQEHLRSLMGVPLLVEGRLIGVIHVSTVAPRHFTADDLRLLQLLADRIALAIDHANLYQAEERARAALEAVFDAMADAVFVFGPGGRVLQANDAARRMFALDAPPSAYDVPLQERDYRSVVHDAQGHAMPTEDLPLFRVLHGETIDAAHAVDLVVRTPGGRERELNMTGAPVRDQAGQIVRAVCVVRDVSERRSLERRTHQALDALLAMAEALVLVPDEGADAATNATADAETATAGATQTGRRLAELTRSMLACRHVAIVALEPETEVVHPVAVAGFSPEDEFRWWRQWEPPPRLSDRLDAASIARLWRDEVLLLDRTQPPFSSETALGRRLVLMVPLRIGERLAGVLSVDYGEAEHVYTPDEIALVRAAGRLVALVNERERLLREREQARARELALREANRRMDEFLGIASHELRSPLTSALGNIQLAVRRLRRLPSHPGDAVDQITPIHEMLQRADRQLHRLNRLVGELLDVSRIQADRLDLHCEPADLAAVVREAVHEQQEAAPERTIRLEMPAAEAVPVVADADRIGQVVTNYLTNALKFGPDDRPVVVGLDVQGTAARVWVRDEGPGLPLAEQERIWERFYRVEGQPPQGRSTVGLGLGLHISRTIVERHGGQVGVESAPGAGATFWFTLPLAA